MIDSLIEKYKLNFVFNSKLKKELEEISKSDLNCQDINYTRTDTKTFYVNERFFNDRHKVNNLTVYKCYKRYIRVFSRKSPDINNEYLQKIDKICNFFDAILGKKKSHFMDIYLFNDKKLLKGPDDIPSRNNVNSGSVLIKGFGS